MSIDLPGFADPVAGAQSAFRAVLDALSRPGRIRQAGAGLSPPFPLNPACAAMLLTLADADTTVFLAPAFADAADWVRFHCGTALTDSAADASFVVADTLPDLAALATGTDEQPQDGATVFLQVPALTGGPARTIFGPGLAASATLSATGLPDDFPARWAANLALFPRGVDLVLCAGTDLLALPRSLTIGEP
jgi:alpha-D-ribose 1-methylphosphonate 5-triphosphate synthase subunit PhnH